MPWLEVAAPWNWPPERRRHVALRCLRALAATLAAVLLVWGVLWLAVPPLLKSQAEQRLSALLGRTVTIGTVQFEPWSLQLTLRNFAIAGAAAADPPLLHVDRIHADADWRSVLDLAPVIKAFELDAPQVHLARTAAGHYDIDDIIERLNPAASAQEESRPPVRFALYNVRVRDGGVSFEDRPVARRHEVSGLLLTLPYLSTLPSQLKVAVEPRLAFTFDGTAFATGAKTTPFTRDRETAMTLRTGDFDLTNAKAYLPADLPVDLQRGRAQADLSLHFALRDGTSPSMSLRGAVKVTDLALADRAGAPLAAWRELQVALADVQPLARKVALGTVRLDGLDAALTRDAQGRFNVMQLAPPAETQASRGASGRSAAAAEPPWQIHVQSFELAGARVRLDDALTPRAAPLSLEAIDAAIGPITWPVTQPAALSLKAQLHEAGKDAAAAKLELQGSATPTQASASLRLDEADLAVFAPYAALYFNPRVEGRAALDAKLAWATDPPALTVDVARASVDALRIVDAHRRPRVNEKRPPDAVAWKRLEVADMQLDVTGHKVAIGQIALHDPQFALERGPDGGINVTKWIGPATSAPVPAAPRPGVEAVAAEVTSAPWQVALAKLSLDGGQVSWRDEAAPGSTVDDPVRLDVHSLRATISGLSWPVAAAQAQVQLSAQVADPAAVREQRRVRGGSIDWKGRVVVAPLAVRGTLRIENFPVHALDRYASGSVNASMQRGQLQWRGGVALRERPGGIEANLAGDLLLSDLHVFVRDPATRAVSQDGLIGWQALTVRGLKVALPPQGRPRIDIAEAVLSDFYSQLVLNEEGRFNLRDAARPGASPTPPGGFAVGRQIAPEQPAEAASAVAGEPRAEPAAAAASGPSPAASTPRAKLPVDLSVGGLQLVNGRVDYTDRLIRPNFSAALSQLNGRVGAFRSDSREMAALELHGRVAGTGLLDIRGSLNPVADPLELDVGAKASELELAPLSPYAGKYAGYAIERGKLSMDLHYNVQPDGKLQASNHVVLNQLTFGDRIESPTATKLPVRLAVALLTDRHGVIDVNLPISGSINDPQFSVGGIVWQVIVNLIVKVVTSPFALFAGGGGSDLSVIEFQPGTAEMVEGTVTALDKVAKALEERPSLQMTVTGTADPMGEAEAIRQAMLEQRLRAQRRNEALRSGAAASAPEALTPEERQRLLRSVYRDTDLPDKPRNAIGLAKDIPGPEMEALLKKQMRVDEESARQLALQRGLVVRDALVAKRLASERMFLAAPKLHAAGQGGAVWTPRAELSLAVK